MGGWGVWVRGARPRTLVAAICPVLVGTAAAAAEGPLVAWRALAALVVALALQVGVNYANDYSDGLRGTDTPARLGPARHHEQHPEQGRAEQEHEGTHRSGHGRSPRCRTMARTDSSTSSGTTAVPTATWDSATSGA